MWLIHLAEFEEPARGLTGQRNSNGERTLEDIRSGKLPRGAAKWPREENELQDIVSRGETEAEQDVLNSILVGLANERARIHSGAASGSRSPGTMSCAPH